MESGAPRRPPGPVPRVYAIADAGAIGVADLPRAVAEMAAAGVRWIQLRAKDVTDAELHRLAGECREAAARDGALLWIDDRADVAALLAAAGTAAAGVHLGQRDLPPGAARRVVGDAAWIGRSTHDREQVLAADADPDVDVVALGPIYPTRSKADPDPVVGLAALRAARGWTRKPLVAIGGITEERVAPTLAAGADAVAVLGAVGAAGGWGRNCERLLAAAEEAG